jgi:hypothetical protein
MTNTFFESYVLWLYLVLWIRNSFNSDPDPNPGSQTNKILCGYGSGSRKAKSMRIHADLDMERI